MPIPNEDHLRDIYDEFLLGQWLPQAEEKEWDAEEAMWVEEESHTMRINDYKHVQHLMPSLDRYIHHHIPTGGFLEAVLSNDLKDAVNRADDENMWILPIIVAWLWNEAPAICWGSRERVQEWLQRRAVEKEVNQ